MIRLLLITMALTVIPAHADTVEELMADDRLRLSAWLEPQEGVVVGQEVRMLIQVSTPRWFAGGTRIALPEIDGLVVLRRDEFATNLSRREAGVTWVIQQWQLELYPQRPGSFMVPPVALELAVNDADAGIVRGELKTPPLSLSATIPESLRSQRRWLATPSLSLEQSFDRDLVGLAPGDAFTRTVEMRASRVTAMMLPEVLNESQQGLAAYPEIPSLENRSNRGEATAIRRQQVTYVVEASGQYVLPEQQFSWWNTDAAQLEFATLPAVSVDAGAAAVAPLAFSLPEIATIYLLVPLALLVLWMAFRQRRHLQGRPLAQARRALSRGDARAATAALYKWLNARQTDWLSLRDAAETANASEDAEVLLRTSYGPAESSARSNTSLLKKLGRRKATPVPVQSLALNPDQPRK